MALTATAASEQSAGKHNSKKSDQSPVAAPMTEGSSSHAGAPTIYPAITMSSKKAVAQTQCPLFLLPTEVRLMIYKHVLETGVVYKDTGARIHTVGAPESKHYFALLKTCRAIHDESDSLVIPDYVLRFPSPTAYATFLCGDLNSPRFLAQNYDRLVQADVQVQVVATTESLSYNPLKILLKNAEQYFDPLFVVEEDGYDTNEASSMARSRWAQLVFNRTFYNYERRYEWPR